MNFLHEGARGNHLFLLCLRSSAIKVSIVVFPGVRNSVPDINQITKNNKSKQSVFRRNEGLGNSVTTSGRLDMKLLPLHSAQLSDASISF
jgi:hypothetical protein